MNTRNSTLVKNNPEVNFETLRSDLHKRCKHRHCTLFSATLSIR